MEFELIDILLRMARPWSRGLSSAPIGIGPAKPVGMRTLGLVSLGSAIVCLATIRLQIFEGHPDALSSVVQGPIQGIIGGIGFIGAGVLHDRKSETIKGLTTAATVWVTAALGIACALAAWRIVAAPSV
jgi:putative Mg2+ transporter-C (MgtC) family protein